MSLRTAGPWADAAVIGSVLVVGVLVAGLLDSSTSIADIPGCSTVQPAPEPVRFSFGYAGYPQYDNPEFAWLTGPKATALSQSLAAALPGDATIAFAAPSTSLYFQPIMDFSNADFPEGVSAETFSGNSDATGEVRRGSASGTLTVSVKQFDATVPPCTEGQLDRRTLSDGTVIDTYEGATEGRLAAAYAPDGSRVTAAVDDSVGTDRSDHSGQLPFTVDDLVAIVSNPGLRVSAPVPAGTPSPPLRCSTDSSGAGPPISREKLVAMNAALNSRTDIVLPQPLGSLNLAELDLTSACETLRLGLEPEDQLQISITPPGRSMADDDLTDSPPEVPPTTLPDGSTVVQYPGSVFVTKPSGAKVSVSAQNGSLSDDQLRSIALTPELDL